MKLERGTRYYEINLEITLFNDFCVECIYGNKTYKNPTGNIVKYFANLKQANEYVRNIFKKKIKKGYIKIS